MKSRDFKNTSGMAALEDVTRLPWFQRPRLVWWLSAAAFMALPILSALVPVFIYDHDAADPVVREFQVATQTRMGDGVIIEGAMYKVRDCELIDVTVVTGDREVSRVDFLDIKGRAAYTRPVGPQKFGPWLVWVSPGDMATIYARHKCIYPWTHSREVGSFIASLP